MVNLVGGNPGEGEKVVQDSLEGTGRLKGVDVDLAVALAGENTTNLVGNVTQKFDDYREFEKARQTEMIANAICIRDFIDGVKKEQAERIKRGPEDYREFEKARQTEKQRNLDDTNYHHSYKI